MVGALIILGVLILIGVILYIGELRHRRKIAMSPQPENDEESQTEEEKVSASAEEESAECCGLHLVCEKDSLSPMSGEIEYFDDEELDRFIGRSGADYTPEETEEFRDVLMTLRPEDVAGWARSVTARRLELPSEIRDELLLLINEQRNK